MTAGPVNSLAPDAVDGMASSSRFDVGSPTRRAGPQVGGDRPVADLVRDAAVAGEHRGDPGSPAHGWHPGLDQAGNRVSATVPGADQPVAVQLECAKVQRTAAMRAPRAEHERAEPGPGEHVGPPRHLDTVAGTFDGEGHDKHAW